MRIRRSVVNATVTILALLASSLAFGAGSGNLGASLTRKIPPRQAAAPSGSQFARREAGVEGPERERAILEQLTSGNLPDFLRDLKPVEMTKQFQDGHTSKAVFFVMPDYLAIGSERDFLSVPMNLFTATAVASAFGFALPTKKMVDAVFQQAEIHFEPEPLPAGPRMRSTDYVVKHQKKIDKQRHLLCCPIGALVSGHKKDVVLTNRLARTAGKIAIYGWHRVTGVPIQPLSTIHGASYTDYSHGIRLVADTVLIDGQPRSFYDVLADPALADLLSDEGTIPDARRLMSPDAPTRLALR